MTAASSSRWPSRISSAASGSLKGRMTTSSAALRRHRWQVRRVRRLGAGAAEGDCVVEPVVRAVDLGDLGAAGEGPGGVYAVHRRLGPGVGEPDALDRLDPLADGPGERHVRLVGRVERDATCQSTLVAPRRPPDGRGPAAGRCCCRRSRAAPPRPRPRRGIPARGPRTAGMAPSRCPWSRRPAGTERPPPVWPGTRASARSRRSSRGRWRLRSM